MSASPSGSGLSKVSKRLKDITTQITSAQGIVQKGKSVNLEGLEKIVNGICEDIRALPDDDQQECKNALVTLIDEFDRLSTILESQHASLQGDIKELSERGRAVSAYGTADGQAKTR